MTRAVRAVMLAAAVLASCGGGGPERTPFARIRFAGTSFADEARFESQGWISDPGGSPTDYAFNRSVSHQAANLVFTTVDLLVPNGLWTGAASYPCGYEPGVAPGSSPYCSLRVVHGTYADYVTWSTSALPAGAAAGCGIAIDAVTADVIHGTVTCVGLPVSSVQGSSPDANTVVSLDGEFDLDVRSP